MKNFTKNVAIILMIAFLIMNLSACGGKNYTQDDLQGYWNDSGVVLNFKGNSYVIYADSMREIESGTFSVEGDKLITSIKTSNISKDEIGTDYNYKIEIENEILYLDENGSISEYKKITEDEAKELIYPLPISNDELPSSLLQLGGMGFLKNSDDTYSFLGYVTDCELARESYDWIIDDEYVTQKTNVIVYIKSKETGKRIEIVNDDINHKLFGSSINPLEIINLQGNINANNNLFEFKFSENGKLVDLIKQ